MRPFRNSVLMMGALLVLIGACEVPLLDALNPTLEQVDSIRDNDDLTAQEKRTALENLGLTPVVINGLLGSERTGNQFGGDLRSAYNKVTAEQFNELTPDEVQIFADEASDVDNDVNLTLDDDQAQAMVDVLQNQNINSKDDILDLLDDAARMATLPADVPDGALSTLFIEFDPSALLEQLP